MPWRCREIRLTTNPVDPCGAERLSHVLNASERLVMAESVDEVVAVLRDVARATVGADGVAIVIQDDGRCSYIAEDAVSPLWQGQTFPADHCISGWVMHRGETVAIPDVRADPRIPQDAYAPTFVRSLVMAPIGRPVPVAALGAYWSQVRTHDDDTVKRLESLARLATIAIENARLTQARNRAAARGAAQNRILELAVEETPLNVALDAIVREVEALSPSRFLGNILLLNEEGNHLQHCAGPGLPLAFIEAVESTHVSPGAGPGSTSASPNPRVAVPDIANDPRWAAFRALAVGHGLQVCGSIPIRSAQGAMLGTFVMYHPERREPLPADIEIGDFLVKTVGLVVHRARAEAAIRSSEARYRQIVEGAEDFAIITFDAQGKVTGWNIGAQRVVGYRAEEVMGRDGDLFYTETDQAERVFQSELALAVEQGRAVNERWHVDKNGARFWGSGLMMPLVMDQGGFVKIFRDRTAEHQAEAALQESAARLSFFDELDARLFSIRRAEDALLVATELLGRRLNVSRCAYADVDVDNDRFWIRSDYNAAGIQSSA